MDKLINKLRTDNPGLTFLEGKLLCWSPKHKQIFYDPESGDEGIYGVLHELGHARLGHEVYSSDIDLLKKESLAWKEAINQAKKYDISLDWTHVQDCLDSYRDWLFKRSTCPSCRSKGVQRTTILYHCINCDTDWRVSPSRFCRPYRLSIATKKAG